MSFSSVSLRITAIIIRLAILERTEGGDNKHNSGHCYKTKYIFLVKGIMVLYVVFISYIST